MRIVILDSFAADQGDETLWDGLRELGDLTVHPRIADGDVVARCAGAAAALTNKVAFSAATFAALPELCYVGVLATGTNVVDLAAARAAHVAVTNVPSYAAASVAQHVMALVLHFSQDVAGHAAAVKAGGWAKSPDFCFFTKEMFELSGKTLAVVGSGAIGNAVARIADAFGMRIVRAAVPGSPTGTGRVPLAEALPGADVVSLHCPLTDATRGMVDARFLAAMKSRAILINTARGALIDEAALIAALAAGQLGGVGLDVLAVEPPPADHPLCDARAPWAGRVVITPHIGWGAIEARRRLAASATDNLRAFIAGQRRNRVD
ncbi:MAG TPA: NAD(P)-dependent oxidoreductase [Polyangia bacterium]|nr:NAD(P)-dependent oxidoreductase [Polyangia bacterium]